MRPWAAAPLTPTPTGVWWWERPGTRPTDDHVIGYHRVVAAARRYRSSRWRQQDRRTAAATGTQNRRRQQHWNDCGTGRWTAGNGDAMMMIVVTVSTARWTTMPMRIGSRAGRRGAVRRSRRRRPAWRSYSTSGGPQRVVVDGNWPVCATNKHKTKVK